MRFEIMNISMPLMQKQAVDEIEKCNERTTQFGLTLTHGDALELVETRSLSLKSHGRIEFGSGAINKIINEFCDSSHISMNNYTQTLHALIEIFYLYKNETMDMISDDDLIHFMKKNFDGICQGSLEMLSDRILSEMAHNLRFGRSTSYSEDQQPDEDDDERDENGEYR